MKLLILLVSCPYGNLHSSRYTRLTNGYRKLQYNGFFRNGFNFRPWNHDAIIWTFFDDGIWSWVPFSYLVSFPLHIVLFSGCNSSTDRQTETGNSCTWARDVRLSWWCTWCTVIWCTHILRSSCFCEIWALCVLWIFIYIKYNIYIYIVRHKRDRVKS